MKKNRLFILSILVFTTLISLQGCKDEHKYYDLNISKSGNITLEKVSNLIKIYNLNMNDELRQYSVGYKTDNDLTSYRMGFHIDGDIYSTAVLSFCDSTRSFNMLPPKTDIPEIQLSVGYSYSNENRDHFYYDIELLKKGGYITKTLENQKNLCLFLEWTETYGELIQTKKHYKSNKLVYKAEEINSIVEAYEAMR